MAVPASRPSYDNASNYTAAPAASQSFDDPALRLDDSAELAEARPGPAQA